MKKLLMTVCVVSVISSLVACVPRTGTPTTPGTAVAPAPSTANN